jgi:hypothetical protein
VCLTSWGVADPADPAQEIRRIARQAHCDGLALIYARRTPLDNALRWNAHRADATELEQRVRAWLDFYREHRFSELAYGIVVFTPAHASQPAFRTEHVSLAGQEADRGQLRDLMRALDTSQRGDLPAGLHVHPDHEIKSTSRIRKDKITTREQVLQSTRGIGFAVEAGPRMLDLIASGTTPSPWGLSADVMASMVRRLYELGLLVEEAAPDG